MLRAGGKWRDSELSLEEKHPGILSTKAHVTRLTIHVCHEQEAHHG